MASFVHRTARDLITVSGPDAASYLQGQLSQDVTGLGVGSAAPTFVLAPQGKVDGWGRVHRLGEDRFAIDTDPGAGEAWEARLRRFLLRTEAEVDLSRDVPAVAVRGSDLGPAPEGALDAGWPGIDGWDLLGDAVATTTLHELTDIDDQAYEVLRIRAGVPRWGSEIGPDTIPATLGQWVIDASVSFTKGCYTGQELVARIDSRGGNVPRRLVGALIDGAAPSAGAEVAVGESSVPLTSSANDDDGAVALLFLPRSVDLPADGEVGGSPAHLVDLPMR